MPAGLVAIPALSSERAFRSSSKVKASSPSSETSSFVHVYLPAVIITYVTADLSERGRWHTLCICIIAIFQWFDTSSSIRSTVRGHCRPCLLAILRHLNPIHVSATGCQLGFFCVSGDLAVRIQPLIAIVSENPAQFIVCLNKLFQSALIEGISLLRIAMMGTVSVAVTFGGHKRPPNISTSNRPMTP